MPLWLSRFFSAALLLVATVAMLSVSFDAEARRLGGGRSFGRQSLNITKQRQAVTPPAAKSASQASSSTASGARTGMSRWLGPLAGIAAGLGIAALLSQFGLSGAFLEMLSSLVLIGLVIAAILFIVRRVQGAALMRHAHGGNGSGQPANGASGYASSVSPLAPGHHASHSPQSGSADQPAPPAIPSDNTWFIPADFDTAAFLERAKEQFRSIQAIWDSGDTQKLSQFLTDDLIAELKPQMHDDRQAVCTEVVLLNAELMGIETVSDGHLASVRYSGLLREAPEAQAARFEEVWNLYKAQDAGWLLAGIQQTPADQIQ